jgi:hypothetical protein
MKSQGPILPLMLAVALLALGAASAESSGLDKLFKQPHMVLPKDFPADMPVLPGKRAFNMLGKKPLEIPPYQVTDFRQGPVTFPELTMAAAGSANVTIRQTETKSGQGYSFKLEENGHPAWTAQCRLETASSRTVVEGRTSSLERTGEVQQTMECELRSQAGGDPWALVLRADLHPRLLTVDSDFDGALVSGEKVFKVSATYAVEGMSLKLMQPSGFLFARGGQWVAAAEWTPPGALRLDSGLDPGDRGLIAAASSALLLYDTLSSPALRN